jgi:transcriptional regulator with PAS, ATPase and Fis domain
VGPFYAVNCASLSPALADAELFGYRKGAFTGAVQSHLGHFRAAHSGTLFLDEVAELPLESQAKLLRAIEQREVLPVGENRPVPVDVRIVAACHTDLARSVERGVFRADLRARLSGYTCTLPPLRDRREDIPALFMEFLDRYSGGYPPRVTVKLVESLCLYSWPNNVRELELLTRSLLALHGEEPLLHHELLPCDVLQPTPARGREPCSENLGEDRRSHELKELAAALNKSGGNVARAAAELGISRQRAYRLMDHRTVTAFVNEYGADRDTAENDAR